MNWILPGLCLGAIKLSQEDLTSPDALLLYGLAGVMLILWLLALVLLRGTVRKAARNEAVNTQQALAEVKDLVDGLHTITGRSSDSLTLFREKVDNRLGTHDRYLEALPRLNESMAKLREAISDLQETGFGAGSAPSRPDPELLSSLEKARAESSAKDEEVLRLKEEMARLHDALQSYALAEDKGNEEAAAKAKMKEVEEARKVLEEERAKFERHQATIKTQIKEAGEKLKQVKDEIREEREKLEKAREEALKPVEAGASPEDRKRLDEEWETIKAQQASIQSEREWLESEKSALEEEKEELELALRSVQDDRSTLVDEVRSLRGKIHDLEARATEAPAEPPPLEPAVEEGLDSEPIGTAPEPVAEAPPMEKGASSEDLQAWGYSSLSDEEGDLPAAEEEDITPLAETATDEKTRDQWDEEYGQEPEPLPGPEPAGEEPEEGPIDDAMSGLPSFGEDEINAPDEPALGDLPEPETESAMPLPEESAFDGPADEDLPFPETEEPDMPEAEEEDLAMTGPAGENWDEMTSIPELVREPPKTEEWEEKDEEEEEEEYEEDYEEEENDVPPSVPPASSTVSATEGALVFEEAAPGIQIAPYAGILVVRLGFEEVKNEEAHKLDEIIFSETSDKEDQILLNLDTVKYINSRGLSSITKIAVQRTAHIVLTNENVLKIMDMMGFLPLFTLFETEEQAFEAFGETEL